MTLDEFRMKSGEILTKLEDAEAVGAIITALDTAFMETSNAASDAAAKITELEAKNTRLQEANMQLFLRTGVQGESDALEGAEQEKGVDFSELFAENGELK